MHYGLCKNDPGYGDNCWPPTGPISQQLTNSDPGTVKQCSDGAQCVEQLLKGDDKGRGRGLIAVCHKKENDGGACMVDQDCASGTCNQMSAKYSGKGECVAGNTPTKARRKDDGVKAEGFEGALTATATPTIWR